MAGLLRAYGFFLTGLFWLPRPSLSGICRNVASPATQYKSATSTIALIMSITVHQCPSNRFPGRCCRKDFRERCAKGTRKAHRKVVGNSGFPFHEKAGLVFQRMSNYRPSCGEAPCKPVTSLAGARRVRTSLSF